MKQAAEEFADKHLPEPTPGEDRRAARWVWFVGALALVGFALDLSRRGFAPVGSIVGVIPLLVVAVLQRKTPTGRRARNLALGFAALVIVVNVVMAEVEALFVLIVLGVIGYLVWDGVWAQRRANAPAAEAEKPV